MQYPKPFMSITTLAEHLDLSVRTVEEWVRIEEREARMRAAVAKMIIPRAE
jgi:hypothetical protein